MWFGIWLTACVTNWYKMIIIFVCRLKEKFFIAIYARKKIVYRLCHNNMHFGNRRHIYYIQLIIAFDQM